MPANIKQTRLGADLDMTGYKLIGEKLKEQVLDDVKASQILAGLHLPDKMFITKDQFDSLVDDLIETEGTNDRLYHTGYNVMEVHVV